MRSLSSSTGTPGWTATSRASGCCSNRCWTGCASGATGPWRSAVGSRVTAVQLGGVLALLSGKVLGPVRGLHAGRAAPGRLLLVAPNIVAAERELDVVAARLPALGVPARGDPPRAVRRGALAPRPPRRARSTACSARPTRTPARSRGRVGRRHRRARRALRGQPRAVARSTLVQTPAQREIFDRLTAVMTPARGPRRRRHGRASAPRWCRPSPTSAPRSSAGASTPGPSTAWSAGCSASTQAARSTAEVRRSSARVVDRRRHRRLQRACGRAGEPAHRAPRSATRRAWVRPGARRARVARGERTATVADAASAVAVPAAPAGLAGEALAEPRQTCRRRRRPGARGVQRRPGLHGAGGRGGARGPRAGACGSGRSSWTTGCRRARTGVAAGGGRLAHGPRARHRWRSSRVDVARRRGTRGRGAAGALRRAGRRRGAHRRGGGPARPHPRRPGRDGAARAGPRVRGAQPGRDGRGRAAATGARCSRWRARRCTPRSPGDAPVWHDPHNADPAYARVAGALARAAGCSRSSSGPGIAAALARSARAAARGRRRARRLGATAYEQLRADTETTGVAARARRTARAAGGGPQPGAAPGRALARAGSAGALTAEHVVALDRLVTDWRGQGPTGAAGRCPGRCAMVAGSAPGVPRRRPSSTWQEHAWKPATSATTSRRSCSTRTQIAAKVAELAAADRRRLRRPDAAAGRRPQGRGHGDGRPGEGDDQPGRDGLDGGVVVRLRHEVARGVVRILKDLDRDITGSNVLVVEDIIDSGLTLSWLLRNLRSRGPASVEVCTLPAQARGRQGGRRRRATSASTSRTSSSSATGWTTPRGTGTCASSAPSPPHVYSG